jgi:hypothetical protein
MSPDYVIAHRWLDALPAGALQGLDPGAAIAVAEGFWEARMSPTDRAAFLRYRVRPCVGCDELTADPDRVCGRCRCSECGAPTACSVGMCYECQCMAHAVGWYDMDTGYARA